MGGIDGTNALRHLYGPLSRAFGTEPDNPLWVADRMILLDHLTRGRAMMGVGPGALPTDAAMIGIDPLEQRAALEEDFGVLMHLLQSDEPTSIETKCYRLVDARSQYRPYSDPCFDIGEAAIASPSGPRLAGSMRS